MLELNLKFHKVEWVVGLRLHRHNDKEFLRMGGILEIGSFPSLTWQC